MLVSERVLGNKNTLQVMMEEVKVMKSYEHFLDTCHIDDGIWMAFLFCIWMELVTLFLEKRILYQWLQTMYAVYKLKSH